MSVNNVFINSNSRDGDGSSEDFNFGMDNPRKIRITPPRQALKSFRVYWEVKKNKPEFVELRSFSQSPNVRCIDCGWKYNFDKSSHCPLCSSEKTYLLSHGSFLGSVFVYVGAGLFFLGFLVLIYKTILAQ